MIYKTLDTVPYKIFFKINSDIEKIGLLSTDGDPDRDQLFVVWKNLKEEFKKLDPSRQNQKIFPMQREIAALECKYNMIQYALRALDFDWNDELITILQENGYTIRRENYYPDLQKVKRESEGILNKISLFKSKLPKEVTDDEIITNVDEIFAFYSSIMGFDFDYNLVSVTKVLGIQRQVDQKIKSIEQQKKRNNR